MSNKIIRCHILDRRDQVDECAERLEFLNARTTQLEQAVEDAKKALQHNADLIAETEKLKRDVEATLHLDWLDNPPY